MDYAQRPNYYYNPALTSMPAYRGGAMNQPVIPRVRPVSSVDEVRGALIDFDGSIFFFPDSANKCIYTKQITLDGTALINMYELKEDVPQTASASSSSLGDNFITREEFEKAINNMMALIQKPEEGNVEFTF